MFYKNMASSLEGEYTHSTETQFQPNTQDNSQEEWPRWVQGDVTTETVTVEYQEGAWTIWGPEAHPKEIVIKDDLITKYNFQESGEGPTPPPVPTKTIHLSVYNLDDWSSTWGTLDKNIISNIPEWYVCHAWSCYDDWLVLTVYTGEEPDIIVFDTARLTIDAGYKPSGIWEYYSDEDEVWHPLSHDAEIFDWMQIRVTVTALTPVYVQFTTLNVSTWQPWWCTLNKAFVEWLSTIGAFYCDAHATELTIENDNCYGMTTVEVMPDTGMQILAWQYYSELYWRWVTISRGNRTQVSGACNKVRAVVYEEANISITSSVWDITRNQEIDPEDAYTNPAVLNNMPEWAVVDWNTSYADWKALMVKMPIDEYSSAMITYTIVWIRNSTSYEFQKWQYYNEATSQWEDIITPVTIYNWMLVRAALRNKCY